jgi:hypothetical protein
VQGDGLGALEQLVERVALDRVAEGEAVGDVVEQHPHAERLREHGQLGADVAVADEAQRATADLVRADGALVPHARVHVAVAVAQAARERDDLADRQLDHRTGVGIGRVEDGDASLGGRVEVDLVGSDAERADGAQPRGGVEHALGHLRARPDAEVVDALEGLDQVVLRQRLGRHGDLEAAALEQPLGVGVDVLE